MVSRFLEDAANAPGRTDDVTAARCEPVAMVQSAVWGWLPDQSVLRLSPRRDGFWYQACVHPDSEHAVFWSGGVTEVPPIWRSDIERPVNRFAAISRFARAPEERNGR
jgi:hypothetical protein